MPISLDESGQNPKDKLCAFILAACWWFQFWTFSYSWIGKIESTDISIPLKQAKLLEMVLQMNRCCARKRAMLNKLGCHLGKCYQEGFAQLFCFANWRLQGNTKIDHFEDCHVVWIKPSAGCLSLERKSMHLLPVRWATSIHCLSFPSVVRLAGGPPQ